MAQQNSINKKTQDLTIDPGAAGDSVLQFSINGTGEFRVGVDDDAADAYKISQGSALGANDFFVMSAAGERTMPLQPCFLATHTVAQTDVTGDGTNATVDYTTVIYDQNGDYDSTNEFTAPITGQYLFSFSIELEDIAAANTNGAMFLRASNRIISTNQFSYTTISTGGKFYKGFTAQVDMDLGDTAHVSVFVSRGTKVVDITANVDTFFSGHLIC